IAGSGSWIFYNMNILNPYVSPNEIKALLAQHEIQHSQHAALPMPKITGIQLDLAIYPYERRIEARSLLTLRNRTSAAIDAIHLELPSRTEFVVLDMAGATLASADQALGYNRYTLATPMQPGEERILTVEALIQQRGFSYASEDTTLVRNGTYFELNRLIPHIGYSGTKILVEPDDREKYGLDPALPIGKLDEGRDSPNFNSHAMRSDSDQITLEVTLSTVTGQTAVTAGRLVNQWTEEGRSYFQYKTDQPIYPVVPFFSAEYAVQRQTWTDPTAANPDPIEIEIYYHPSHAHQLDIMLAALQDGLAYYGQSFGPYQYQQLRVMEYPLYRNNSRSLPTIMAHSESDFVKQNPSENYATMAHELSHHWWGHQVIFARVEGAGMMEGLATYSARMLVEAKYGKDYFLHPRTTPPRIRYLRGRNSDRIGETPLNRAL
ncbi:MAG: hypothetical protein WD601_05980, partial [Pseudohongiellaceae bacterium]